MVGFLLVSDVTTHTETASAKDKIWKPYPRRTSREGHDGWNHGETGDGQPDPP